MQVSLFLMLIFRVRGLNKSLNMSIKEADIVRIVILVELLV